MTSLYLWLKRGLAVTCVLMVMNTVIMASEDGYRVVAFGDSTTANRGGVRNYALQLGERFPDIEVINKGVGGHSTSMAARRFQADVLDQSPDLVVIQFGINDAAVDVWKVPPAESSRVSLADFENNLRQFVSEIREAGAEVILMTPNQVRWTPKLLEKYGKAPYDPDDPQGFSLILADYAQCVRDLAEELELPLVDVYGFYDTPERRSSTVRDLLPDGMHPSEQGHALVAEGLIEILEPKIVQSQAKSID